MSSPLYRSSGLVGSLLQRGLPTASQTPSDIHLLQRGVPSTGYRWIPAPPWISMGYRGSAYLSMVFITSCKGRLSAPASRAPPPPSSSLALVSAELFLSHCLIPPSQLLFSLEVFFPLLKYFIRGATTADWLRLGQQQVCLRDNWHWLYQIWGNLLAASHRIHPYSPPCDQNLAMLGSRHAGFWVRKLAGGKLTKARECAGHQAVRVALCILLFVLCILLISIIIATVCFICCSVNLLLS